MNKLLLLSSIILGCSGQPFSERVSDEIIGQGGDSSSSRAGTESGAGFGGTSIFGSQAGSREQTDGGTSEVGGWSLAGSSPTSGSSGAATMAGAPAMGEGGGSGADTVESIRSCLRDHQTLECARVCDSSPYCQGILDCFVRTNSNLTSDCPGFSNEGYSLAQEAERLCCNG